MADIICRWRNGTPKTVMELVNSLPHEVMPISQFRNSMKEKWNGEFFHTPYQLACQLALYCEAEDGMYYPRFDHDINETEAHRYLELWINRYYIPNPYVASDGFNDLECPTYLIKTLYDYVCKHPGCDYESAYLDCFHDDAKNNDDIVRNYINRYSKVLSFSKEGKLSTTKTNAKQIFSFMDRNNKKEFFDTFGLENEKCLMDSYLEKDIDQKKEMFYEYLKSTGLSESSCKQYAYTHPFHEEVIQIVQEVAHKSSLFDVIDGWLVKSIHKLVCPLEANKKQGNAWSAAISNYKNFLDYLEVGVNSDVAKINVAPSNATIYPETDYINFKHLLEYFCAHLQYVVTGDEAVKGYDIYLKPFVENGTFKKSGQGYKDDNIQKQIEPWEQYNAGKICIAVHGQGPKGTAAYLHWNHTGHNVLANWNGDTIISLKLVDYLEPSKERITKDTMSLDELGLYDGQEPNENLKKFYDAFVDLLKNDPNMPMEEPENSPLEFGYFTPRQIIYYGAPGTGKSHTIKQEEDEGKITCIRTTFHPDSDYATFVGCYKPHKTNGGKDLTYEFVEQAFLEAYKQAWMNPTEEIALVIEEINRGNCAQVFGDIFQLLDRSDDGWSTYPIKADTDIAEHLKEHPIPGYAATMNKRFGLDKSGCEKYPNRDWYGFMALPPNMSILATMNTSDQSLFPIDSAFKRRWDWKYIKIKKGKSEDGMELGWKIQIENANGEPVQINEKNTELSWWDFINKVNEIIASMTSSADKQLGYFFCKPSKKADEADEKPTIITADTLVGKVIFYLWNDVFKDYGFEDASLFTYEKEVNGKKMEKDLAFADFYDEEGEKVDTERLVDFLQRVMKWQNNKSEND